MTSSRMQNIEELKKIISELRSLENDDTAFESYLKTIDFKKTYLIDKNLIVSLNINLPEMEYGLEDEKIKESLLHILCRKNEIDLVEKILKANVNNQIRSPAWATINIASNRGDTPLHIACIHGHKEIVDLLLKHHAAVNTVSLRYLNGTPLSIACEAGHYSR